MISYIRSRTLELLAPRHRLRCTKARWSGIVHELARRGNGNRESGAFLLGRVNNGRREILDAEYYDDLYPHALQYGTITFPSSGYEELWRVCSEKQITVVADVHTHPGAAFQSATDSNHPMIANKGHVALIIPDFAQRPTANNELGIYEYLGGKRWTQQSGLSAEQYFIRTRL
jgi:proteasome lid subunit RPN8/RPN11